MAIIIMINSHPPTDWGIGCPSSIGRWSGCLPRRWCQRKHLVKHGHGGGGRERSFVLPCSWWLWARFLFILGGMQTRSWLSLAPLGSGSGSSGGPASIKISRLSRLLCCHHIICCHKRMNKKDKHETLKQPCTLRACQLNQKPLATPNTILLVLMTQ